MTTEATPGALGSNDGLGPLPEDALRQQAFLIISRLQSGTEDVVRLDAALAAVAAERERCAAKAGEYAQAWWSKHCASNKHMETTRAAHDDFCRLQADIRRD